MELSADSALVGLNTSSTSAVQGGIWNPIFGWIIRRRSDNMERSCDLGTCAE